MKIVDRATFLAMPAGTLFAKAEAGVIGGHGNIAIKGDTTYSGEDFFVQDLLPWPQGADDTGAFIDAWERMEAGEEYGPLEYDCEGRDGLFDGGQRFIVWSPDDLSALITRLQQAYANAAGEG